MKESELATLFKTAPGLFFWQIGVYVQLIGSFSLLFYILLTPRRKYFAPVDYLVLLFIPLLGMAYAGWIIRNKSRHYDFRD